MATNRQHGTKLFHELAATRTWRRRLVLLWRPIAEEHSRTTLSGNYKRITVMIDPAQDWQAIVDCIRHELGHAAEHDEWEPHGPAWARHHAAFYRAWEELTK